MLSDLAIHHSPQAGLAYRDQPAIRWSADFSRWCVFDPKLIRQIMKDPRFAVPSYDLEPLERRFGIDLSLTRRVVERLPLAHEGGHHQLVRKNFARMTMDRSEAASSAFEAALADRLAELASLENGATFCLFTGLLRQPLRAMIAKLSGYPIEAIADIEQIPQHFDDSISIKRRVAIEATLRRVLLTDANATFDSDLAIEQLGIIMVSANTLLGSLTRSLIDQLLRHQLLPLGDIPWQNKLPCTALPLVEKTCLSSTTLADTVVQAGQRLRLYLEADGFNADSNACYSDLFFATGPHKCVGMSLSLSIWSILIKTLAMHERSWSIVSKDIRSMDRVFHLPEKVLVRTYAS